MKKRRQHKQRAPAAEPVVGTSPPTASSRVGALGLIVAAVLVAYLPAIEGGFIWDDDAHVTQPELRSLDGLYRIWFDVGATQQHYPLLHSLFWIEHRLWGDAPLGYHLANVLLHVTVACLAFTLLRRLKIPGAALAAAIFALHPVHVESVAWITEQKNTLSAVFYLSAMLVYLRFDERRATRLYLLAFVLFVLGLLSKTVTATLPAALLVIFWWQRGSLAWRRDVLPLVPWFALAAAAGLFTAWVEHSLIGAQGAAFELSWVQRSLLAGRVLWFYLAKLLWPVNLIFIYPRWEISPAAWWQWLFPLATLGAFAVLWAVRGRWRGPLAAGLLFVGTLFPVLGFLNVYPFIYSFVADHFQYLASLPIIALAAAGATLAIARLPRDARWIGKAGCVALLVTLATLTWQQAGTYADAVTLYRTTIQRNPNCPMAYNNLGVELTTSGRVDEAIVLFQRAIRLKPDDAEAHNNLASALFGIGRTEEARTHFEQALRIDPNYASAHYNLATLLAEVGDTPGALKHFEQSLRRDPNRVDTLNNIGNALLSAGQTDAAIARYSQALDLQPDHALAHFNLGRALQQAGRLTESIEQFETAVGLRPESVKTFVHMAQIYAELDRPADAVAALQKAIEVSRSQGQADNVQQIETLLREYQSQLVDSPPPTEAVPTAPEP